MKSFIYKNRSYGTESIRKIFGCNNQTACYLIKRINEKKLDPAVIFDYKDSRKVQLILTLKTGEIISSRRLQKLAGISYLGANLRIKRALKNLEVDLLLGNPAFRGSKQKKRACYDSEMLYEPPATPEQEKLLNELRLTPEEIEIESRYYPPK